MPRVVDLLRPRHEASKMEPTVHGSWSNEFLFCKPCTRKKSPDVRHSAITSTFEEKSKFAAYPVKANGTPSNVEPSPDWRNQDGGERGGR